MGRMTDRDRRDASFERASVRRVETHYIAPFTRINGRKQEAVCGAWVVEREYSAEPTCATCAAWLQRAPGEDAATAAGLGLVEGGDNGKA